MKAAAIGPATRGLLGLLVFGALAAILPFFFRYSFVGIVLEVVVLIAAVTSLYMGMSPAFRVAKSLEEELRAAGVTMNKKPALDEVARFRQWLAQNDLTGDQIAAICDGPSHSGTHK
jgi:hypothetical protein